jgi:hypothetical protein
VRFAVDKVALGQSFLRVLRFFSISIIPSMLHIHLYNIWEIDDGTVSGRRSTETVSLHYDSNNSSYATAVDLQPTALGSFCTDPRWLLPGVFRQLIQTSDALVYGVIRYCCAPRRACLWHADSVANHSARAHETVHISGGTRDEAQARSRSHESTRTFRTTCAGNKAGQSTCIQTAHALFHIYLLTYTLFNDAFQ